MPLSFVYFNAQQTSNNIVCLMCMNARRRLSSLLYWNFGFLFSYRGANVPFSVKVVWLCLFYNFSWWVYRFHTFDDGPVTWSHRITFHRALIKMGSTQIFSQSKRKKGKKHTKHLLPLFRCFFSIWDHVFTMNTECRKWLAWRTQWIKTKWISKWWWNFLENHNSIKQMDGNSFS